MASSTRAWAAVQSASTDVTTAAVEGGIGAAVSVVAVAVLVRWVVRRSR